MVVVANAGAAVRAGSGADPPDNSGGPDISGLSVSYDTDGAITIVMSFHASVASYGVQSIQVLVSGYAGAMGCQRASFKDQLEVTADWDQGSFAMLKLDPAGSGGATSFNGTQAWSPDHTSITITANSSVLAGRGFTCASGIDTNYYSAWPEDEIDWFYFPPPTLTLTPSTGTGTVGKPVSITPSAFDGVGAAINYGTVRYEIAGANTLTGQSTLTPTIFGPTPISWTSQAAGRDTITAFFDWNGSGVRDAVEPEAVAHVDWSIPEPPPSPVPPPAPVPSPAPPPPPPPPSACDGLARTWPFSAGAVLDPQDVLAGDNGSVYDIARACASFDRRGKLRLLVRFHDPVPERLVPSRSHALQWWVGETMDSFCGRPKGQFYGTVILDPGPASGNAVIHRENTLPSSDDQELQTPKLAFSSDRREVEMTVTDSALAGRAYVCAYVMLNDRGTGLGSYDVVPAFRLTTSGAPTQPKPQTGGGAPAGGAVITDRRACRRSVVKRALRRTEAYRTAKRNGGGLAGVRCLGITGDRRGDALFAVSGGGTAGNQHWGVLIGTQSGKGRLVKLASGRGLGIGVLARRPAVASPIYLNGDANCCATGGFKIQTYRWQSGVLRVAATTRRARAPAGFDFRPRKDG